MSRIPLPAILSAEPRLAHPYPFQISFQTLEFLQGALFYAAFADTASGQQVRRLGGIDEVESAMARSGLDASAINEGWAILGKYKEVFEASVRQSALVSMNSHWDWYVRRLANFIRFSRSYLELPELKKADASQLARADRLPITEQLDILQVSTGIDFGLTETDVIELFEMTLIRNIGLHNRWEIDETYLKKTQKIGLIIGDLRIVEASELQLWHSLLIKVISRSSVELAKEYRNVLRAEF